MTHTKEPGLDKKIDTVCLVPGGSASETVKGISHLFEHIFIYKIHRAFRQAKISGHTTEDYVILFGTNLTPQDLMTFMREMSFTREETISEKEILIREIKGKRRSKEESFFKFAWKDTVYEKSPLGEKDMVNAVTTAHLEDFKSLVLKRPLYFYTRAFGLEIRNNPHETTKPGGTDNLEKHFNILRKRGGRYKRKWYDIFYFDGQVEEMYVLERGLKLMNPGLHIQLSEKKRESALIVERGTRFPAEPDINSFREKALQEIKKEVAGIKENFSEQALNELESIYFYNKGWSERLARLFQTTDSQLLAMVKSLAGCTAKKFT